MKLVIDEIGTTAFTKRTIVDLAKVCAMSLEDGDGGLRGGERLKYLYVTFEDGFTLKFQENDNMFGLSDGHGGAAAMTLEEVMNAYLTLGEESTGDKMK